MRAAGIDVAFRSERQEARRVGGHGPAGFERMRPEGIVGLPGGLPVFARHFQRIRFPDLQRSEEHTTELQSLMRISYAVFCLKKKKYNNTTSHTTNNPHL